MDTSRLLGVLMDLNYEVKNPDLRGQLGALATALQNASSQPSPAADEQFKVAAREFFNTLDRCPSNDWVPSKREILEATSLDEFTGRGLRRRIESALVANEVTRATALAALQALQGELKKKYAQVEQAVTSLREMGIDAPTIEPGEAEVGFLLPTTIDTSNIQAARKELHRIDQLLRLLAELVGDPVGSAKIKTISAGSLTIFALASYATVKALLELVNGVLDVWQRVIDLKKKQAELTQLDIPQELLDKLNAHVEGLLADQAEKLAAKMVANRPVEEDRKNELRTQLVFSIKILADHIDRGAKVEATPGPLPDGTSDAEQAKAVSSIEMIRAQGAVMGDAPRLSQPVLKLVLQERVDENDE